MRSAATIGAASAAGCMPPCVRTPDRPLPRSCRCPCAGADGGRGSSCMGPRVRAPCARPWGSSLCSCVTCACARDNGSLHVHMCMHARAALCRACMCTCTVHMGCCLYCSMHRMVHVAAHVRSMCSRAAAARQSECVSAPSTRNIAEPEDAALRRPAWRARGSGRGSRGVTRVSPGPRREAPPAPRVCESARGPRTRLAGRGYTRTVPGRGLGIPKD